MSDPIAEAKRQVQEVVSTRQTVSEPAPGARVEEAAVKMRDLRVGMLPVMLRGRPVGVVTDRDITVRAVARGWDPKVTRAQDVMSAQLVTGHEDEPLTAAFRQMEGQGVRRLVV